MSCLINIQAADSSECALTPQPPVACKNPCEYTQWSTWGEWQVNDVNTNNAAVSGAAGFDDQR